MGSQVSVDKLKIGEISKVVDIICVKMNTRLTKNAEGIKNAYIELVLNKGVSESQTVSSLFCYKQICK